MMKRGLAINFLPEQDQEQENSGTERSEVVDPKQIENKKMMKEEAPSEEVQESEMSPMQEFWNSLDPEDQEELKMIVMQQGEDKGMCEKCGQEGCDGSCDEPMRA